MVFWPVLLGVVGLAVLWRQADEAQRERWLDTHRPDRPRPGGGRRRRLGGLRPARRRCRPARSPALVLFALQTGQSGQVGVARDVVVAGVLGVAGLALDGRAVAVPARRRPLRGARRAGPHPGARRRRRAPARLGAADPRADPEARRRPRRRSPGSPARRSATCGPGCTASEPATRHAGRERAARRRPPRSRTRTASRSRSSPSATRRSRERLRPAGAGRPRGDGQRGQALGRRPGRRLRRGRAATASRSSSATAAPASTRTRCPRTGSGVRSSIVDRMDRHGGTAEIRTAPGEGTEVRLHHATRDQRPGGDRMSHHRARSRRDRAS